MMNSKKKLALEVKNNKNAELYFFDESRFGTHSKIGHGWFETGKRTQVEVSLGFKNFYVYSAVSSTSGDALHLVMPSVDTDCMNAFLEEMALQLEDKTAIIVLDGAGWHRSSALVVPNNIRLVFLPPYSPELNPVEKLWEYVKSHTIKNKIYTCIDKLEEVVGEFISNILPLQIRETCRCVYLKT